MEDGSYVVAIFAWAVIDFCLKIWELVRGVLAPPANAPDAPGLLTNEDVGLLRVALKDITKSMHNMHQEVTGKLSSLLHNQVNVKNDVAETQESVAALRRNYGKLTDVADVQQKVLGRLSKIEDIVTRHDPTHGD